MVIKELIEKGVQMLRNENPVREARLMLSYLAKLDMTEILVHPEREIDGEICVQYENALKKRTDGMPFAYIVGEKEFFGHTFRVTPDVLIPRADTETLVEFAISKKPTSLLDICTGSGCIAISIKKELKTCEADALDISDKALEIARENANALDASVSFFKADIMTFSCDKKYDMVVSNPPYIKKADLKELSAEVAEFEPMLALDGGDSGLMFYERIVKIAPQLLNESGILAFELGFDQYTQVFSLMEKDFKDINFVPDLSGIRRVIYGTLK